MKKKVHSTVLEILKTIFIWYGLPWHELTEWNMFRKASLLKRVDKKAIRFTKFVQIENEEDAQRKAVWFPSKT